jgi:hypothetical protein
MPRDDQFHFAFCCAINSLQKRGRNAGRSGLPPQDLSAGGVYRRTCLRGRAGRLEIAVKILIAKSLFAAAAVVTVLGGTIPAAHAAGGGWRNEPWCAFFEYDDVTVDCSYRTFEECYPNVIGGIRGTCGPNPDRAAVQTPVPGAVRKHKKQHVQR